MLIAALWFSAMRMPLIWHRLVTLPEIFVTNAASPKPISRTRWQKLSSPLKRHTRPVEPAGNWQRGESSRNGVDILEPD